MNDLDEKWGALIKKLEAQFDDEVSLKGILYLIGIQELNFGIKVLREKKKSMFFMSQHVSY